MTGTEQQTDAFSVEGRQALIIGGTRGIGQAISWQLAFAGARVLATYVRDDRSAAELADEARQNGVTLEVVKADATSAKGLEALMATIDSLWSPLSILVFAAATGVHRPFDQLTLRHFDWTFGLNVRAFFEMVQRLLPKLQPGSSIVAISSEGAVRAVPQYALVGTTKGALEALVRHLAAELGPRGIRVNALSPGTVETDAWKALPDAEQRLESAARRSPRGRLTSLQEVAWSAQFLCSEAAAGVNGHTLVVDGGTRIVGS